MTAIRRPIRPMLATVGKSPTGPGWASEIKWDGMRGIADTSFGRLLRITSRDGNNVADSYPELLVLTELLGGRSVVLDGEILALDGMGRPALRLLQRRMQATPRAELLARIPVYYYVFDVLEVDGKSVMREPYSARRQLLAELGLDTESGPVRVPSSYTDTDAAALLNVARFHGLEGIVSKRLTSKYQPGTRSRDWIKTLCAEEN